MRRGNRRLRAHGRPASSIPDTHPDTPRPLTVARKIILCDTRDMAADTDTSRSMIAELDRRIARLQQIRAMLVEEHGHASDSTNGTRASAAEAASTRGRRAHGNTGPTRKSAIHAWLKANGPATRNEVISGSGLPEGTVGSLLSRCHELFENRDGKWHAR